MKPCVTDCTFCGQGLLRFMTCRNCHSIFAVCDECELLWSDIKQVFNNPDVKSDSNYSGTCPFCKAAANNSYFTTNEEISSKGLDHFISGYAED